MGNALDFEKIRRRRQRAATLKRLLILAGVMLLVGAAVFFYQILVEEGASITLSDLTESLGGSGFPVDLPGGVIRSVDNIGNNLAVLNDTNLYIYNPKAKVIRNVQKMTDQTIAIPSSNRVLTFALAGKSFSVHSLSRELYSGELEYGIICGDINNAGDFAVSAPVKQFASKVYVYNKRFEEIYTWSSPEYVTAVSLSPKGDAMALNCVSSDGGALESLIYIFRFGEEKEKATVAMKLEENLCLDINFAGDERIDITTDRQYLMLNSLGEEIHSYDFKGSQLSAIERNENAILLLLGGRDMKTHRLVLLDSKLEEKASADLDSDILDLALSKDSVYILTRKGIDVYGYNLTLKSRFARTGISEIHTAGGKVYYLANGKINVLMQSELAAVNSGSK